MKEQVRDTVDLQPLVDTRIVNGALEFCRCIDHRTVEISDAFFSPVCRVLRPGNGERCEAVVQCMATLLHTMKLTCSYRRAAPLAALAACGSVNLVRNNFTSCEATEPARKLKLLQVHCVFRHGEL